MNKELLKAAVYSRVSAHEDKVTAEEMMVQGVLEEHTEQWLKSIEVAHRASEKARDLAFEAAWLVLKANDMLQTAMMTLAPERVQGITALSVGPDGMFKENTENVLMRISLRSAHDAMSETIRGVFVYGTHMLEGQCETCGELECKIYQQLRKVPVE